MLLKISLLQVNLKIGNCLNTFKVAAVDFNGEMHTMVLDIVEEITDDNLWPEYETGDQKLIFKNTYDSEEYGKEKKFEINSNDVNAPDAFYYVHIDVDLYQIEDCLEPESDTSDFFDTSDDMELSFTENDQTETTNIEPEFDISNDEELSSTQSDQSELTYGGLNFQQFNESFFNKTICFL